MYNREEENEGRAQVRPMRPDPRNTILCFPRKNNDILSLTFGLWYYDGTSRGRGIKALSTKQHTSRDRVGLASKEEGPGLKKEGKREKSRSVSSIYSAGPAAIRAHGEYLRCAGVGQLKAKLATAQLNDVHMLQNTILGQNFVVEICVIARG